MAGAEKKVPQPLHRWPHAGTNAGDELMPTTVRWHKRLIQSVPKPVGVAGLWILPQQDTRGGSSSSSTAVLSGQKHFRLPWHSGRNYSPFLTLLLVTGT